MIIKEHIQTKKHIIVKNSEEEKSFIAKLIETVKGLNIEQISSKEILEQKFTDDTDKIWFKHLKTINITKYSKLWWNKECQREFERYRVSK